jgi:hypothetical protein
MTKFLITDQQYYGLMRSHQGTSYPCASSNVYVNVTNINIISSVLHGQEISHLKNMVNVTGIAVDRETRVC